MDTRKYKQLSSSTPSLPQEFKDTIIETDDSILQYDQIKNDYKYLDATIFNLCEKIAIGNQLQENYFNSQQTGLNKTNLPKWLKYSIHNTALIPIFCISIVIMKWRKSFSLNKAAILICGLSVANEFFKFQNCMQTDEKLAKAYKEHQAAYDDLFFNLVKTITFQDMLKHILNIDLSKDKLQSDSQYDTILVEDFAMSYY